MNIKSTLHLLFVCCFCACTSPHKHSLPKPFFNKNEIEKIVITCDNEQYDLDADRFDEFIKLVNSAKPVGLFKAITKIKISVYLTTKDSIKIRAFGSHFKWDKSGDWTYELRRNKEFFDELCVAN